MRRAKLNLVIVVAAGFLFGGVTAYAAYYDYTDEASYGTPTNLGPTVNSPKDVESLHISRDGLSLYFSSQREGGHGDYDLWVTRRPTTDANWGPPENLGSPPNSEYAAWMPSVSSDELTLYFSDGPYGNPHPGGWGNGDIWVSTRASPNDPWGEYTNEGANVDARINLQHAWAPCVSADGLSLYLSSHRPGTIGLCDLWVAKRETTSEPFWLPVNLGPNINSSIQDHAPDISADELTLFFSRGAPETDGELWVTTRPTVSDPWGPAVQLPPHVDMESCFDVTPSLSPDGSTLYFTSHRSGGSGEGDIWEVPILQLDVRATKPSPANGATDVPTNVVLGWSPRVAGTSHDVYFGASIDDVNNATTSSAEYKGRQNPDANTFDPPGLLELTRSYYWRIDEVDDPCVSKGSIWSFTTREYEYLVVDDMEDYSDSNPIRDTWIDGWENGTGSFISLGTAPGRPAHGGDKSMWFNYDNWEGYGSYSESCRTFSDPCDWTVSNVNILALYFYGDTGNDATEQMYTGLEDSRGAAGYAEARYGDQGEDMNDILEGEWHEWKIALQDFNDGGVNLADVNSICIGFGDRETPVPGGSGMVYFDDIRLYVRRCVLEFAPVADFTGDCMVDSRDFAVLAGQWMQPPGSPSADIAPETPDGIVNWLDLDVLVANWLEETVWPGE